MFIILIYSLIFFEIQAIENNFNNRGQVTIDPKNEIGKTKKKTPALESLDEYLKKNNVQNEIEKIQRQTVYELKTKFPVQESDASDVVYKEGEGLIKQNCKVYAIPDSVKGFELGIITSGTKVHIKGISKNEEYILIDYFDEKGFVEIKNIMSSVDFETDPRKFSAFTPIQTGLFTEISFLGLPAIGAPKLLYETDARLGWGFSKNFRILLMATYLLIPLKVYGIGGLIEYRSYLRPRFFYDFGLGYAGRFQRHYDTGKIMFISDINLSISFGFSFFEWAILKTQVWFALDDILNNSSLIREMINPKLLLEIHF